MVIVTAADDRFALPLGVMVHSLLANAASDTAITLYVLSQNMSAQHRRRLESVIAAAGPDRTVDLHWIEAGKVFRSDGISSMENLKTTSFISEATYLRLLIPDYVSTEHCRVIYLDADLLVERDLTPLWTQPFNDADLLAVRDYKIQTVSHPKGLRRYKEFGLSPDHPYFNAGVLVINLEAWRKKNISAEVFSYLDTYRNDVNENDQDGLNAVLATRWRSLDPRWNRQTAIRTVDKWPASSFRQQVTALRPMIVDTPFIDHFTEGDKPWNVSSGHPSRDRFLQYLSSSAWFTPIELRAWRALQTLRIPEEYLRTATRPLRHRVRGILSND